MAPCRCPASNPVMKKYSLFAVGLWVVGFCPLRLSAQLVRENTTPPAPPVTAQEKSAAEQVPSGKKRLSQEVQLTGEESWIDTGIDVQAGEHALITATGKLRYAD